LAKSRSKRSAVPAGGTSAHAAFLSTDLSRWAGHGVARGGRRSALLGQVEALRLVADGATVEASVRDTGRSAHDVRVTVIDGRLSSRCTCDHEATPCKHAVATVEALRFPRPELTQVAAAKRGARRAGRTARGRGRIVHQPPRPRGWILTRDERVVLARESELHDRRTRARKTQARVKRLPGRGGPPRFHIAGGEPEAPYTVVLRGSKAQLGSCTCPDFAKNELATCKHVERARNWFARRRKRLPKDVLSLWWRPREWSVHVPTALRELRVDGPAEGTPAGLAEHFDAEGWLRPAPDGQPGSAWARQALEAVEIAARQQGLSFDLDAAVPRCIASAADDEVLDRTLSRVEMGGEIWTRIVPGLGMRLHPYQNEGVQFIARRGRAFLADDMGLGKTVQAIAAALCLREAAGAHKALVVCPASLKYQWRREIEKACGEHAGVLEASRVERARAYDGWDGGFLVLNYELVLRDLDRIRAAKPDLVILDEAQRIKNWDTKTAKAVKRLESPHAFILTGTPLENRLVELHSLVEFLYPRALGPRWRLFPFHAVTDPQDRVLAYEGLDVLRNRLSGFFLRRERADVLDQLPERTDNTFWTELSAVQRRAYRRQAARIAALLAKKQPLGPNEIRVLLQTLTSMRILCNAHAQHAWERVEKRLHDPAPPTASELRALHSPKLEEFVRVLEDVLEESGSKVVVFSQWERMLRLAQFVSRELLAKRAEESEMFHGALDGRKRRRVLESFRERPEVRVLFSTDAGGLGLNLQDSASVVVNLEVPWNPAVLEQRIGRVHRLGQRRSVQVLHFVTRGAIEERVRHVVESKRALFEGLLIDDADRVVVGQPGPWSLVEQVERLLDDEELSQRG
jgi:superfamily II DNA or RNA helicase